MLRWLKNLYASWRDYVGAELTDDVRRVYDRMLAADVQAQTDPELDAMLGMEESFLAEVDLTSDERAYLDDLRTKAATEATANMYSHNKNHPVSHAINSPKTTYI